MNQKIFVKYFSLRTAHIIVTRSLKLKARTMLMFKISFGEMEIKGTICQPENPCP